MSKIDHDTQAAIDRPVDYNKPYFNKAIFTIKKFGKPSPKILDIGAGNGEFAEMIRKELKVETFCIDYADPHLERIKELGFETMKVDFDSSAALKKAADSLRNSFDVVTAFEFIEHAFALDDFLAFVHTVLKPDGLFIVSTPNLDHSFYHIHSLVLGNIPMGEGHHVRFFHRRRLTQALVMDGFEVIDEQSYGRGMAYWYRLVGEGGKFWELFTRGLGRLLHEIIPTSSSKKFSKLVLVAKRVDSPIFGFDQTWRTRAYANLSDSEKKSIFSRLIKFRRENLFIDMPLFRKFFDEEAKKYL